MKKINITESQTPINKKIVVKNTNTKNNKSNTNKTIKINTKKTSVPKENTTKIVNKTTKKISEVLKKPINKKVSNVEDKQNILLAKNYYDKIIKNGLLPLSNELKTINDIITLMLKKPNIPKENHDILKLVLLYDNDYTDYISKNKISTKQQWEVLHNVINILCGSKKPWENLKKNNLTFSEIENKLLNIFINNNV